MRGEKYDADSQPEYNVGSSPHARGKVSIRPYLIWACRIIPACAGKSMKETTLKTSGEDHPRMRGEKKTRRLKIPSEIGSSPHARGKAVMDSKKP